MPVYENLHLLRVLQSPQEQAKNFVSYCRRRQVVTRGLCRVGQVQRLSNILQGGLSPPPHTLRGLIANKNIPKDENIVMLPARACLHAGHALRNSVVLNLFPSEVQKSCFLIKPFIENSRVSDRSLIRHNQLLLAVYMAYMMIAHSVCSDRLAAWVDADVIQYLHFLPRAEGDFEQLAAHLRGWLDGAEVCRIAQNALAGHFKITQAEVRPVLVYALCMIYSRMVPVDHRDTLQSAFADTPLAALVAAAEPVGQSLIREPISFLCPVIDMCNHSDSENVAVMVPDREPGAGGPVICLRSIRDIAKDEELTMTYGATPTELKMIWEREVNSDHTSKEACRCIRLHGTSQQWVQRQAGDPFVVEARKKGYVSRSAFKLIQLDDRFKLLDNQRTTAVVDLGCSPGGWCQVIRERANSDCRIFGVDLLAVRAHIPNAVFLQGDFSTPTLQQKLLAHLGEHALLPEKHTSTHASQPNDGAHYSLSGRQHTTCNGKLDLVTSDMCPNRAGGSQDRQRICILNIKALTFSITHLKPGGHFVCKVLGASGSYEELLQHMRRTFLRVHTSKPPASRMDSDEAFLVGFHMTDAPRSVSASNGGAAGGGHYGLDDWPGFARRGRRDGGTR